MSTVEKQKEKVPWIPLAVLSAVLAFLTMGSYSVLGTLAGSWQCGYNLGMVSRVTCYVVWPYLLLTILYPFRKRFKLSSSLLTYLYSVGAPASYTLGFAYIGWVIWPLARTRVVDAHNLFANMWWEPPLSAINSMVYGNVATNWAEWGPIIAVVSLQYIAFFFFTSTVVLIFRRAWFDTEQIPFPLTIAGHEILKRVESGAALDKEKKPFFLSPFWIGFILAFVFEIPIFMARTFPWFPDVYSWRAMCPSGTFHPSETDLIGQVLVGYTGYSLDAIAFAMALLVPLSVSFNVWFWTLVMWVFDQIAYATGSFTGMLNLSAAARMCCSSNSLGFTGPFRWNLVSMVGGFLALALMQIFLRRSYLLNTIKAAIGKSKPDWEKDEVMSYRSMYIMLVLSFIVCMISQSILGVDFWASFLLIAFNCFTTWLAMLMLFGLGAFGASDCRIWPTWTMRIRWPEPPSEITTGFAMSELWAFRGSNVVSWGYGNGYFMTALNLKMAKLTGTSVRNTFLVTALANIIAVPVLFGTHVWLANIWGSKAGWVVTSSWDPAANCISYVYSLPSNYNYALYGTIGFISVTALSILHASYTWFPFEPIGFLIATNFGGLWNALWSVYLAAWIVKTITLRVGGSKLYESVLMPSVGGFAAGIALATLFGCLAGVFRFYVPY